MVARERCWATATQRAEWMTGLLAIAALVNAVVLPLGAALRLDTSTWCVSGAGSNLESVAGIWLVAAASAALTQYEAVRNNGQATRDGIDLCTGRLSQLTLQVPAGRLCRAPVLRAALLGRGAAAVGARLAGAAPALEAVQQIRPDAGALPGIPGVSIYTAPLSGLRLC